MTKLRKAARSKEEAPMSAFTAADNIKYRKYQNQMAMKGRDALSKSKWAKAGKPVK